MAKKGTKNQYGVQVGAISGTMANSKYLLKSDENLRKEI